MFRSINSLQFIFVLLFYFHLSSPLVNGKNEESFENYVVDVLFTNALTIVRCNQYERFVLRTVTMQSIGELRCENADQFLPSNHLEQIALFEWQGTQSKCVKKSKTTAVEETTILKVVHKSKNSLKKHPLKLIRVGSTESTEGQDKNTHFHFKHAARTIEPNLNENYTTNIYSIKHRPILCREKYLNPANYCDPNERRVNVSYFCYYRAGVKEPPTIADMEQELTRLSKEVDVHKLSSSGHYTNRKTKEQKKKSMNIWFIGGIVLVVVIIISGGSIWYFCCNSESDDHGKRQSDSNVSRLSKDS